MERDVYDADQDNMVDVAEGLRETGGPTTLTVGAVTDGQLLKRDGATITSEAAASSVTSALCANATGSDAAAVADKHEVVSVNGSQYLRLLPRTTFPEAVADSITDTNGWTWVNSGALDSADENTTTADAFNIDHDGTGTDWTSGGTHTAPFRYRTYTRTYSTQQWVAFISGDGDFNYATTALMAVETGDDNVYAYVGPAWNGADKIRTNTGGASTWTNATAGQRNGGIWFRLVIDIDGRVLCEYAHGVVGTLPTAWTRTKTVASHFASAQSFKVGIVTHTTNATDGSVGDVYYLDDDMHSIGWDAALPKWPAQRFDTGNTEVPIITDLDLTGGSGDAPTIDQARLRKYVADAVNLLDGDAATWTFSCVTDAGTGASSAAYNAAASLVVEGGAKRYFNLFGKPNSDGTQPGSFRFPLPIPVS